MQLDVQFETTKNSLMSECHILLRDLVQTGHVLRKLIYGKLCFNVVFSEQQVHALPPTSLLVYYPITVSIATPPQPLIASDHPLFCIHLHMRVYLHTYICTCHSYHLPPF